MFMDQFELYLTLEKAKTLPLEKAEIQELSQTSEIKLTMNQIGLIIKPTDIGETVNQIIENLKENPEVLTKVEQHMEK
jgi:hypothetical protein